MDPTRGGRHFTKWVKKKKIDALKRCGIAPYKYSNNKAKNDMLRHLADTDLPLNGGQVLKMLQDRSICYAGANSKQQMAYVLLRNMTTVGELPVLYVQVEPVFKVTGPNRDELAKETLRTARAKSFGVHRVPYAYRYNNDLKSLWKPRREAWDDALKTLGEARGLQLFMEWLTEQYVQACNNVLLYNPKQAKACPSDLKVQIDMKQSEAEKLAPKMFAKYWNDAVQQSHPAAVISGEPEQKEWGWAMDLLKQVRSQVSVGVRCAFDNTIYALLCHHIHMHTGLPTSF